MCGIAGLFKARTAQVDPASLTQTVRRMIGTLEHRGPDAAGLWSDPQSRCVLGHRRLSIIDTSDAGIQPMASGSGRWLISFNGEIYNFEEVKATLRAEGISFRGRTDTEVLIEAVARWGTEALSRLDGMFAFAAFDTQSGELLLARDAFGEKPLYYMELADGRFAFASELQALEQVPGFDGTVDVDAMAEVLAFQYIGAPRSIYRDVKKLPPGTWLKLEPSGRAQIGRYFGFRPGESGFQHRPMNDLVDELEDILVRSIRRRLVADVPLGAFLSGGVDSSTVCALIRRKLDRPLMTFSIGFDGAPESEHETARAFANHLGTEHHDAILDPDAAEFLMDVGRILDEPNADSSCLPTYLLSGFARRHVTVAMSGDGGDEMFGGYGRYFETLAEAARRDRGELPGWRPGKVYFGSRILVSAEQHIHELFNFVPPGFGQHLADLRQELDQSDELLCAMRRSDTENYMPGAVLPKVDRMSMQHSLEVRTPFLTAEVARFAERLPDSVLVQGGRGKLVLRELAYRYLPRELIDLPKQGFGLPISDWARTSLLGVAAAMLEKEDSRLREALGPEGIARFMSRQRKPDQFSTYQVWALAMLESWLQHHPAKLPSLADGRETTRLPATSAAKVSDFALHAVAVSSEIYLVTRGPTDVVDPEKECSAFAWLTAETIAKTLELIDLDRTNEEEAPPPLRLPDWGRSLVQADHAYYEALRGCTLIFIDPDAERLFDYSEAVKLNRLGVRRVVLLRAYVHGALRELELRDFGPIKRTANALRLWPKRLAVFGKPTWMRSHGARPFGTTPDGAHTTDLIGTVDVAPDEELSSEFMVFEGTRQLPPVQASHSDIGLRRNGRYSVWNQRLTFSETEPGRSATRPYWVVRRTPETDRYLQIAPREALNGPELSWDAVQAELAGMPAGKGSFALTPGDRVVVCTHGLPPGGAERQWVYLAQALRDEGYDVTFVVYESILGPNGHYLPILQQSGVPLVDASAATVREKLRLWPRNTASSALLRSDLIRECHVLMSLTVAFARLAPKVVFAQLDHPNVLSGFAAHLAGVPRVVTSFRNYNPTNFPYIDKPLYLPAYRALSASRRVAFSGNHRGANEDYARWIGIDPGRITYIPNAVEPELFPVPSPRVVAKARADLGVGPGDPVVLGVFRLSREKDPATFIRVCFEIARAVPNARAFIAGVGPLRDEMQSLIGELGLEGRVSLLGRRSDVNVLISLANLFLLTSTHEGMPNVLLEAQLMGAPVVATSAGGIPDSVLEGATALVRPVGDVAGLAAACVGLIQDPARARAMGAAGREHVLTAFPKREMGRRYLAVAQVNAEPDASTRADGPSAAPATVA